MDIFNKSLDNNEEGIVLKKSDFIYKPNAREGTGCYKVKAEVYIYIYNIYQGLYL